MSDKQAERKHVPPQFFQALAAKVEVEARKPIPADMDFPTLDDMEMDVPFLGVHLDAEREFPEDESDLDMQYLMHVSPTLAVSSLSV